MIPFRPSRRQVLRASVIGGIAVYLAPLGSGAFASLVEQQLLTRPDWNSRDGALKYRIDATSKVTGEKVFARDIRARDMPHWPQQQSHALVLRATSADRSYAGFDLAVLGTDLPPDRVVTAADLLRDGLAFPDFYGEDMLLPEGKTPAYLGQAVAILIYHDFARFRFAKQKLQFNDAVVRYGAVTGPLDAIRGARPASFGSGARRPTTRMPSPASSRGRSRPASSSTNRSGRSLRVDIAVARRACTTPSPSTTSWHIRPRTGWC